MLIIIIITVIIIIIIVIVMKVEGHDRLANKKLTKLY